mgnify:FL=1
MNEREIEGKVYILKSDVENIVKQRLDKVASRANQAEQRATQLQDELDKAGKATATIDLLTQQVEKMKGELEQSNTRFSRYQAISKHGLTDPDIIDAIEWSYERAQSKLSKKEKSSLGEWLDTLVENPENAPTVLRPHFSQLQPADQNYEEAQGLPAEVAQNTPPPKEAPTQVAPPATNTGVRQAPEAQNLIERGIKDPDFYAQNRQEIMQAWRARRKGR